VTGEPHTKTIDSGVARARVPLIVLGLAFVLFAVEAARRGLRFPTPWSDEGSFLWPALAFRDRFDLFAPEINPHRDALWMPPGFMVMHGLLFSVIPFSLERARAVSTLLVGVSVFSLLGMMWPLRARLLHAVLASAALTAPIAMMVGNTARMESFVLALVVGGFCAMSRGRAGGFALVLLAPLVHPNGVFALAGASVYGLIVLVRGRKRAAGALRFRLEKLDVGLLAFAVLAWAAYGAYVARHWAAFLDDMAAQFRFKLMVSYGEETALRRLLEVPVLAGLVALLIGSVLAWRYRVPLLAPITLAGSLFVQTAIAAGWLYEVYPLFALLISTMVLVESSQALFEAHGSDRAAMLALALAVPTAVGIAVAGRGKFLTRSMDRAVVLREPRDPEYYTAEDKAVVTAKLQELARDRGHIQVQFLPSGEGLVFEALRGPSIGFVEQTFFVNAFDVVVVHESAWLPRFIHDIQLLRYLTLSPPPLPNPQTIRERDGSERWLIYPLVTRAFQPPQ
jgi:hypothetical protein